jgi:hypothetical protein
MISGPHYINLDHRIDRKILVEEEFRKLNIDSFVRFPAIYMPNDGISGCLSSHVKLLESAPTDGDALWICEDDVEFKVNRLTLDSHIKEFMESDADILCLGFANRIHKEYSNILYRTYDTQTTSSYIVKPKFRKVLHDFWKSVLESRQSGLEHEAKRIYASLPIHNPHYDCADQCWKVLQQSYVFVIPKTRCLIQRVGYSDIEHRIVNYGV